MIGRTKLKTSIPPRFEVLPMLGTLRHSKMFEAVLMILLLVAAHSSFADSIRCGTHLISTSRSGPGKYEVLKKCGEPDERRGYTWIYKQGRMIRELTFAANGRLDSVRSRRA